ncbi:MAG: DUF4373 domain-containing protein [Clostridia bacterium]|nr:DUF4373 domain-containing protein [Clostridia bacterium]
MAGRNTKTNFDFFRLDTDFFSNKKIKALRRHFGSVGILTYLYILSYTYGNDGYYIRIDSVEEFAYDIAESIGNSNLTQIASVATDCINYLASRGEINKHLLDKGVISGESIQRHYIKMCLASKRKVEFIQEYQLVDTLEYPIEENPISSEEIAISSEEIPINSEDKQHIKLNKNKEDKVSKKEIKKENLQTYDEIFEDMGVSTRLKSCLIDFIRHLKTSFQVLMINSRLEKLIIKLDEKYGLDDVAKCKEVRRAIVNGYKRLECEEIT